MSTQLHPIIRSTNLRSLRLDVMATMFKSVCPVTIKFSEVDKRRDIKIQWYSDSFYTHPKGYKMCLHIITDGIADEYAYLSLYLHIMKGPHDDELSWPLIGEFEIKLLNQIGDYQHRTFPWNYDNAGDSGDRVTVGDRSRLSFGEKHFIANYV